MFVARKSNHIQEDIKRNWSSWNFGEEGLLATEDQIEEWKENAIDNEKPFCISGFELWDNDIKSADIRELYSGYWVLVDNINAKNGLSCRILDSETLEEALVEFKNESIYSGDGDSFDSTEAKLIYSEGEYHIFEIED